MSTSSDIISLFNTAWESYATIFGPPTDNNMVRLREDIITIVYSISLGADAGCPSGLILIDEAYKLSIVTTVGFNRMISAYKSYDPSIEDDATDGIRKKWSVNGPTNSPPSRSSDPVRWYAGPSS